MARKTIKTIELVDKANAMLRDSADDMVAERHAIHTFTASLLMEHDCYNGYDYLNHSVCKDVSRTFFYKPRG
tara:strand:- start:550 stop:765 length:216 start_codon:yes stop_codon:yes gene_type:complete